MKAYFDRLASRVDALGLRERVFLFLALLALCVALADVQWVGPARALHQQAKQKFARDNVELQRLRQEVKGRAAEPDAMKSVRDELAQLKAAVAVVNTDIAALAVSSRTSMTLQEVLVHFLERHAGLTLVRTSSVVQDGAVTGRAGGNQAAAAGAVVLVRQGLELTVSGPYPELMRYVLTLEGAMPELRWGLMKLAAEQRPPELTLQVFLVRPQP